MFPIPTNNAPRCRPAEAGSLSKCHQPWFVPRSARATISLAFLLAVAPAIGNARRAPAEDPPVQFPPPPVVAPRQALALDDSPPTTEWVWHKSADGVHPDGNEQTMLWLMNRARSNPPREGVFLSNTGNAAVEGAIEFFEVDLDVLRAEFDAIPPRPPAAFDRRLHAGSTAHSLDLIARDAQDHNGQFDRMDAAGFHANGAYASVFSFAMDPVHAHAGFNIDWGDDGGAGDGMQPGRGHRAGLMSTGEFPLPNVGIAMVPENNPSTDVGPLVVSIVYAQANPSFGDHFNKFIVGTVWADANGNARYDPGEGLDNVRVMPQAGTYYAVTGDAGGYSIPVSEDGTYVLEFSGGDLAAPEQRTAIVEGESELVAWLPFDTYDTGGFNGRPPMSFSYTTQSNGVEVSWEALDGQVYAVRRSSDLVEWTDDARPISIEGDTRSFFIPEEELAGSIFFRVMANEETGHGAGD